MSQFTPNRGVFCYNKSIMIQIQDTNKDDAVNVAPQIHKVIYEDDKMRVLKVTVKPGDVAMMHWHPRNINYILKAGKLKFTDSENNSKEVELSEGMITSSVQPVKHAVENTGNDIVETIQVELK